jgi:hypothetical protein
MIFHFFTLIYTVIEGIPLNKKITITMKLFTFEEFVINEKKEYFMKDIAGGLKHGALRKQLGIAEGETIPKADLNKIIKTEVGDKVTVNGKEHTVTAKFKKRAVLAKEFKEAEKK